LNDIAGTVLSRSSLVRIIDSVGVSGHHQAKAEPEDAIAMMKSKIRIRRIPPSRDSNAAFVVRFLSSDPVMAQRVAQELTACFMDANIGVTLSGKVPITLRLDQAPSLFKNPVGPNWWEMSLAGVVVGALIGLVLSAYRHAPKTA
jgi:hypothetical protein